MKKIIFLIVVISLAIIFLNADVAECEEEIPVETSIKVEEVEEPYTEEDYYRDCLSDFAEGEELPVDIFIAVSRLETGNWKNIEKHWNFGGLSINEKPLSYPSMVDGLRAYTKCFAYHWNGNIYDFAKSYCPANKNYANQVIEIIEEERL